MIYSPYHLYHNIHFTSFFPPCLHGSDQQPAEHTTPPPPILIFLAISRQFSSTGPLQTQGEPVSEANTWPHREAAADLLPDRHASVKAKGGVARPPSQLYTSLILRLCCVGPSPTCLCPRMNPHAQWDSRICFSLRSWTPELRQRLSTIQNYRRGHLQQSSQMLQPRVSKRGGVLRPSRVCSYHLFLGIL